MANEPPADDVTVISRLFEVIARRRVDRPAGSYTTKLFDAGRPRIAQKVGEEAVETVIAALDDAPAELVTESADLIYHLLVLWADAGVRPDDVWRELAHREKPDELG